VNQKLINFIVLALLSGLALAASVPNTFTANTPAVAAGVNANFTALVAALTDLEDRVTTLEHGGGPPLDEADFYGSYTGYYAESLLRVNDEDNDASTPNGARIESHQTVATLTLSATGCSYSGTNERISLGIEDQAPADTALELDRASSPDTGCSGWSLNGATLNIGSLAFSHAARGRVLIGSRSSGTGARNENNKHSLLIYTRND
jgi:hypothetical protein